MQEKSRSGPLIGICIVLVMLVIGAIYYANELRTRTPEAVPYIPGDASAQ